MNRMWIIMLGFVLSAPGVGHCITCEECREMDQQRNKARTEMSRKEEDLEKALTRRDARRISQIRIEMTELRKKMLALAGKSDECEIACNPYIVKETQCSKLKSEIVALDSDEQVEASIREKVDELYKKLLECNQELKKLKKPESEKSKKPTR